MNDLLLSSPIWILFLFSLFPLTLKVLNKNQEPSPFLVLGIALFALLTSMVLLLLSGPFSDETSLTIFSSTLVLNSARFWGTFALQILSLFVVTITLFHPQVNMKKFSETIFLQLGSLLGLMILVQSGDLLMTFIGLEVASLCFYLLIALGDTGPQSLSASFKYFVLGSLASALLLYGISFVFGSIGHFDLAQVLKENPQLLIQSRFFVLALVFLMVGFLFKISIFPFQFWLPDVYRGSFTPLLIFMAVGLKLAVFVLLFDWTKGIFSKIDFSSFLYGLQWLAVLSILFGNIIALVQSDLKKMLLFSTIAHSGYLLLLLIAIQKDASGAFFGLFYYLVVYMFMTLGAFICLRPFEKKADSRLSLEKIKGVGNKNPLFGLSLSIFLFSLAGLPPTGGFVAKFFLFQSLLEQKFFGMVFWVLLGSSISLFYYLKPIMLLYTNKKEGNLSDSFHLHPFFLSIIFVLALSLLLMGVFPSLLQNIYSY